MKPIPRATFITAAFLTALLAGVVATTSRMASAATPAKLMACSPAKAPFGTYRDIRVSDMSCAAADALIAAGGPVEAKGWYGKSKCTFVDGKTTFTARCSLGPKYISYTAPLAGGKA